MLLVNVNNFYTDIHSYFSVPNVELSPLCSPHFRSGPPGEQAQVMSQFMLEVVNQWVDLLNF